MLPISGSRISTDLGYIGLEERGGYSLLEGCNMRICLRFSTQAVPYLSCNEFLIQCLRSCQRGARLCNQPHFPSISSKGVNGPQVNQCLALNNIQSGDNQKMSQSFSNNNNSINIANIFHYTAPDDESEILEWLSLLDPRARHREIGVQRVDGIGAWLLETEEFRGWRNSSREEESNHATLFCDGSLGVGKSYIL